MAVPFAPEARLMRALAHTERMAIIATLRDGSACVCHLTAILGRPQAYVSQQLAVLRAARLIEAYRDGGFTYYRLTDRKVLHLLEQAARVTGSPQRDRPGASRAILLASKCGCPRCRAHPAPSQRRSA